MMAMTIYIITKTLTKNSFIRGVFILLLNINGGLVFLKCSDLLLGHAFNY